ncbi:hypothetical protein FNYG_07376 [Fusarium nygamai]|uniref:Uncharacterized protein n=1 Tax=Gibberella nygamai TaxID=42673 RepID=A0A2K0WAI6_GIBNY|nr:hypothetical protein FNYG_07376 [Fusarium nygamai]
MLPIRRAFLSTSSVASLPPALIPLKRPIQSTPDYMPDQFNRCFQNICSLRDHGRFVDATVEARDLIGRNMQQKRLAHLLLASLELFSRGSVSKTVATCAELEVDIVRLIRRDCDNLAPVDFQLIFVWFQTLVEIYLRRSTLCDLPTLLNFSTMSSGLPPIFENDGKSEWRKTAEGESQDMLQRNWAQFRILRGKYCSQARSAESFDLFSVAWMLYEMADRDCQQLSALEDDYNEVKRFAESSDLSSLKKAITHCWCAKVAIDSNLPQEEVESELVAIAMCLPPETCRTGLEHTVAAFASLMAKDWEGETISDLFPIGAAIENQIMNRVHLCSELQAVVIDDSDMAVLHRELTQARESVRVEGLWKQFASIEKMLALENMMTSDAETERQRYLALARITEAHSMGPVYLFDAQTRAFTITQARKFARLQGEMGVATELPEITWYEGFFQRYPDYDWEADCASARMQLLRHYAVLNDTEKFKHNLCCIITLCLGLSGSVFPIMQAALDSGIDQLANLVQGKDEVIPNNITPAQERFGETIGLSSQFTEAAHNRKPTGIDPSDMRRALDQYFPGVGDYPNTWDRLAATNGLLSALGIWSGKAEPRNAEDIEHLDQIVRKALKYSDKRNK